MASLWTQSIQEWGYMQNSQFAQSQQRRVSRRTFLGTTAAVVAAVPASAASTSVQNDLETRLAKHDLKDVYKDDLPTPCMVVDQEIFEANLKKMAGHCKTTGIHLRAHVKVHKSVEIARQQIALGANGITCATVAECELISHAGI